MIASPETENFDLTLTAFLPKQPQRINKKEALEIMRSKWLRGDVSRFDVKLGLIMKTSAEKARLVRLEWQDLGFLEYDKSGLLIWNDRKIRGFFY